MSSGWLTSFYNLRLKIYYRSKCKSNQKAFMWFERYGINFEKQNISQITVDDLLRLLMLTTEGINELIKNPERVNLKNEEELEKNSRHEASKCAVLSQNEYITV